MRVLIHYHVDVDDDFRREVRAYYGESGLANRDEIKAWFRSYGSSMDADLMHQPAMRAEQEEMAERVREEDE